METFDYVIIGSGSAGSVLANRLSEDPSTRVCVLEAGPSDWHPYIHLPAGFIKTFHMKSINWAYQQEVGPWTGGRSIYAPRGKTLGGSSSINGHIYNRGQRMDFDTWAQMGNRGWGYADVLPYFRRLEKRVGEGEDVYRGRDGNLTVTTMNWRDPLCEAFMEGAVSLGIPRNPDYNGSMQEGVCYCQRTIDKGLRVSASTAFLKPAMKRPNVHVHTHAHATEIIFEGKRAVGVRYMKGGRGGTPVEVRANKEVILSGGTYNSPQLLQLSGIGSPDLLQAHGIAVRHALPIIQTNYLDAELDRRVIVGGMKLARRLLKSAPLSPYYAYEDFPGPNINTDDEFLAAATERGTTTFHPGCTCRMGPADSTWAVVDDQLRVHGLQNLRVVDASIMPRMISANLNASTLMIADKASDLIRGRKPLEAAVLSSN